MLKITDSIIARSSFLKLPAKEGTNKLINQQQRGFTGKSSHVYFRIIQANVGKPSKEKPAGKGKTASTNGYKNKDNDDFEIDLITLKKKNKFVEEPTLKTAPDSQTPGYESRLKDSTSKEAFDTDAKPVDPSHTSPSATSFKSRNDPDLKYPSFMQPSMGYNANALREFRKKAEETKNEAEKEAVKVNEEKFIDDIKIKLDQREDKVKKDSKKGIYRLLRYPGDGEDVNDLLVVQHTIDKGNKINKAVESNLSDFHADKHSLHCGHALNEQSVAGGQFHGGGTNSKSNIRQYNKKLLGNDRKHSKSLGLGTTEDQNDDVEYRNLFAGKENISLEALDLSKLGAKNSKKIFKGNDTNEAIKQHKTPGKEGASFSTDKEFYNDDLMYEKMFANLKGSGKANKQGSPLKKSVIDDIVNDIHPADETTSQILYSNQDLLKKNGKTSHSAQPQASAGQAATPDNNNLQERFSRLESVVNLLEKRLKIDSSKSALEDLETTANEHVPAKKVLNSLSTNSVDKIEKLLSSKENIQILEDLLNDIKVAQKLEKESKFREIRAYEWSKNKILHPGKPFMFWPFLLSSRLSGLRTTNDLNGYFSSFVDHQGHKKHKDTLSKSFKSIGKDTELFPTINKPKSTFIRRFFKKVFATIGISFVGLLLVDVIYPDLLKTDEPFKKYEATLGDVRKYRNNLDVKYP